MVPVALVSRRKNRYLAPMQSRLLALSRLLAAAFLAFFVLAPSLASAAGTVTITDLQPKEVDGKWKLKMTMNYGSTPPTAHIPMLFIFTPTMLYERTLTDKSPDKPVLNKIALSNQQAINESMDVGFSDAAGKVFNITKFDFEIRRDHGFEAGEYTLVIKRSNDDAQMGQQFRLVLQGDNVVVDRRAMVFSGEKKKEKKENAAASEEKKEEEPKSDPAASGPSENADTGDTAAPAPEPVPPRQGGCGCRVAGSGGESGAFVLAFAGFAAFALRRRSLSGSRS
jgi:MYXO-CTERM domain-containing protein